jgi:hypothetical protein
MLSNYPDGLSDYSVGAPWNEPDVPERDFEITCSQSLSRTATVCTNNYIPGASGVDYEPDDEGGYCACGWHDPDDTSDTNWSDEYKENGHYTPLELINKFKEHLMKQWDTLKDAEEANDTKTKYKKREIQHLIEECDCWSDDETEYIVEN